MKGIILAGGNGTRLRPLTLVSNKHLLPVYDKTMIEYPLDTLKHMGITDILIVSGGDNIGGFAEYFQDGKKWGVNITYRAQVEAGGIAQALSRASDFSKGEDVAVILGDNIFENTFKPIDFEGGCLLYIKKINLEAAKRFGCVVVENGKVIDAEEKPKEPKSDLAITGLYVFDNTVFERISELKPSARGELEITDVIKSYIEEELCSHQIIPGFWSDAGTFDSLLRSSNWVQYAKTI